MGLLSVFCSVVLLGSMAVSVSADCSSPPRPGPKVIMTNDVLGYGRSVATYSCPHGYGCGTGCRVIQCIDNKWEQCAQLQCVPDCPEPPRVAQATVTVGHRDSPASLTAEYVCVVGFEQTGGDSHRWCKQGVWVTGVDIQCSPIRRDCPSLATIRNGDVRLEGNGYSQRALYTCDYGFVLRGSETRECYDGVWNGNEPSCEIVACRDLSIANGRVDYSPARHTRVATYVCNVGFGLKGEARRECNQGQWTGQAAVCVADVVCPTLAGIRYGSVTQSGSGAVQTASYVCDYGFELRGGDRDRYCDYGQWQGQEPSCDAVNCPDLPTIRDGSVSVSGSGYEMTAVYRCDYGFSIEGDSNRQCNQGVWNGYAPRCVRTLIPCPTLRAPARCSVVVSGASDSQTAFYTCDYGFNLVGSDTRRCSNGVWGGYAPSCVAPPPTTPPPPPPCRNLRAPAGGSVDVSGSGYSQTAFYTCGYGFILVGRATRRCNNGVWGGYAPTCVAPPPTTPPPPPQCPSLSSPVSGSVVVSYQTATYSCDYGFNLVGSSSRQCVNGYWIGAAPVCVQRVCGPPPSVHYAISIVDGNTAYFLCDVGYAQVGGDMMRTCNFGVWARWNEIKCQVVTTTTTPPPGPVITQCGPPPSVYGAMYSLSNYGSVATYCCNPGHSQVSGLLVITCTNGVWCPSQLVCQPTGVVTHPPTYPPIVVPRCPRLFAPAHAKVTVRETYDGAVATYECLPGCVAEGGHTTRLCKSGQWIQPWVAIRCVRPRPTLPPTPPTPPPPPCPAQPEGTRSTGTAITADASNIIVTFVCTGRRSRPRSGDATIQCVHGVWTGTPLVCSRGRLIPFLPFIG